MQFNPIILTQHNENIPIVSAVVYDDNKSDAFEGFLDFLFDETLLQAFFSKQQNLEDLTNFWKDYDIELAVNRTIIEANLIDQQFYDYDERKQQDTITHLFITLSEAPKEIKPNIQRTKYYGPLSPSWIRIYGLRLNGNRIIITGGAIKLTKTMHAREHTLLELKKMDQVRNYLIMNRIVSADDIEYIIF